MQKWHKMKGVGTKKRGKLKLHFASQSHIAALKDLAHFMHPIQHVNALIDKIAEMFKFKKRAPQTLVE